MHLCQAEKKREKERERERESKRAQNAPTASSIYSLRRRVYTTYYIYPLAESLFSGRLDARPSTAKKPSTARSIFHYASLQPVSRRLRNFAGCYITSSHDFLESEFKSATTYCCRRYLSETLHCSLMERSDCVIPEYTILYLSVCMRASAPALLLLVSAHRLIRGQIQDHAEGFHAVCRPGHLLPTACMSLLMARGSPEVTTIAGPFIHPVVGRLAD